MITFKFKPLEILNFPLIFEWLSIPHVAQWWRESKDWEEFSDKYTKWIESEEVGPFMVYHEDKPIGYIQWYDVATDPIRKESYPERTYGIDLFIADLAYVGKGYGAVLITQFIKKIVMPLKPNLIITDPEITNLRAIHVYEKVGFRKTRIVEATDGTNLVTAQLMELEPAHIKS
jgi:aminoglycoside 6'-N-acetyltransferase